MRDHILLELRDTGLWHGLLYRNHPTPSGLDRAILALSANEGKETEEEALAHMVSGLNSEYLKSVDLPTMTHNVKLMGRAL